jgi:hypothetical protein
MDAEDASSIGHEGLPREKGTARHKRRATVLIITIIKNRTWEKRRGVSDERTIEQTYTHKK